MIRELKVPCPPLPLQNKFGKVIEMMLEIKNNQASARQNTDALFDSLMQKAFKGELV